MQRLSRLITGFKPNLQNLQIPQAAAPIQQAPEPNFSGRPASTANGSQGSQGFLSQEALRGPSTFERPAPALAPDTIIFSEDVVEPVLSRSKSKGTPSKVKSIISTTETAIRFGSRR